MTTLEELKPCPFCGGPGLYKVEEDHHGSSFSLGCAVGFDGLSAKCLGANAFYTADIEDLESAISAWNHRYREDALESLNTHKRESIRCMSAFLTACAKTLGTPDGDPDTLGDAIEDLKEKNAELERKLEVAKEALDDMWHQLSYNGACGGLSALENCREALTLLFTPSTSPDGNAQGESGEGL